MSENANDVKAKLTAEAETRYAAEKKAHETLHYRDLHARTLTAHMNETDQRPTEPSLKSFEKQAEKEAGVSAGKRLMTKVPFLFKKAKNEVAEMKAEAAPVAQQRYQEAYAEYEKKTAEREERVRAFTEAFRQGHPQEVIAYFSRALGRDRVKLYDDAENYKPDIRDLQFADGRLSFEFRLPDNDELRPVTAYKYSEEKNALEPVRMNFLQVPAYRLETVRALMLRYAACVFMSDECGIVREVLLTGRFGDQGNSGFTASVTREAYDGINIKTAGAPAAITINSL